MGALAGRWPASAGHASTALFASAAPRAFRPLASSARRPASEECSKTVIGGIAGGDVLAWHIEDRHGKRSVNLGGSDVVPGAGAGAEPIAGGLVVEGVETSTAAALVLGARSATGFRPTRR